MKSVLLSSLILLLACMCSGQEATYKHMVGINATSFVKSFLSFNDQAPSGTPFQFTYRRLGENGKAFRSKIGLNISNSQTEESADDDKSTFTFVNLQTGFGYEKRFQLEKRWLIYAGFDGLFGIQQSIFKNTSGTEQTTNQEQEISGGISPVLGIQFNITDRLNISTEAGVPITYRMITDKFSGLSSDSKVTTTSLLLSPTLPTFLFLNLSF